MKHNNFSFLPPEAKVRTDYRQIKEGETIEEILCLAVLISQKELQPDSDIFAAKAYYDSLDKGCESCPFCEKCLACIINE
jgi:hypothetical protein